MKTCLPLLLFSGLLASAVASSPSPTRKPVRAEECSPGTWTYDGCNVCRCTEDRKIKCTGNVCRDAPPASCRYGRTYVDQCNNVCLCTENGNYECKPRDTPEGGLCYHRDAVVGEPLACSEEGEIGVESNTRLYCENDIVRFEYVEDDDRCRRTGSRDWVIACNRCWCTNPSKGTYACTYRGCHPQSPPPPHQPSPTPLHFGDVVVPEDKPCPAGLREAPGQLGVQVCRAKGCTPGGEWNISSCEKCICTSGGEPACTPCAREKSGSTVLCGGRTLISGLPPHQLCAADCGQRYIPEKDCLKCLCGVGEEGDVSVGFDEPCPEGFDHRANDAFSKICGPVDQLPKGDFEDCENSECPARCTFVRQSDSGCVYCQCEGHELVSAYQECPPSKIEGPVRGNDKVCKPANREECGKPGAEYSVGCDLCICQANGVPACTKRDCTAPVTNCLHGPAIVDECDTLCRCVGTGYACGRRGCPPGRTTGKPLACPSNLKQLPRMKGQRVFCHNGIVKAQPVANACIQGSSFMDSDNCNRCFCSEGRALCTKKFCLPDPLPISPRPPGY